MQNLEPNQFSLSDRHLKINYSTSGIQGRPTLSFNDGNETLDFQGDEIRVLNTEIGKLVSVTIALTVDSGSTEFSFLIPQIEVAGQGTQQAFETVGIKTVHKVSLGPQPPGVREKYEVHYLKGTAESVQFLAARP
jgi:hypothetical protein